MPKKTTGDGRKYEVKDRTLIWTTEDGDTVTIPMRLKLKVIRSVSGRDLDVAAMFDILDKIAPDQSESLDEMDVNDFSAMFTTWQDEYNALTGATPGE